MAAPVQIVDLMAGWLKRRLAPDAGVWFADRLTALRDSAPERDLVVAFGMAPRKLGKTDLDLDPEERAAAAALRDGWDPTGWSVDQAARLCFLLEGYQGDDAAFVERLQSFFRTADVGETICLYRGLPLYPGQDQLVDRAREGARTNIRAVFESVGHRNPFPRERFAEQAWNHMIVKALFVGTSLHPIQGLDERRNPELMRMLCDYAHERWAAGRPVTPELWRCVGVHADGRAIEDLARVLRTGNEIERQAAALALIECPEPAARQVLDSEPSLDAAAKRGELGWDSIAP